MFPPVHLGVRSEPTAFEAGDLRSSRQRNHPRGCRPETILGLIVVANLHEYIRLMAAAYRWGGEKANLTSASSRRMAFSKSAIGIIGRQAENRDARPTRFDLIKSPLSHGNLTAPLPFPISVKLFFNFFCSRKRYSNVPKVSLHARQCTISFFIATVGAETCAISPAGARASWGCRGERRP
jgi:hypothetical protein